MIDKYITIKEYKVFCFFLRNKDNVYNFVEVKKEANVCYSTAKKSVKELLEKGMLVKTLKIGKSDLYKLNKDHQFVSSLLFYFEELEN